MRRPDVMSDKYPWTRGYRSPYQIVASDLNPHAAPRAVRLLPWLGEAFGQH